MDINDTKQWQRPLIDDRLTPYIEVDAARLECRFASCAVRVSVSFRHCLGNHWPPPVMRTATGN